MSWNNNKNIKCRWCGKFLKDKGWKWECPDETCGYVILDTSVYKTKLCPKCKIKKVVSEFSKCATRKDNLQFYCKQCTAIKEGK